jgi:hypothetical protein
MTSANLLIVILVGTVAGALTALGLGDLFSNQWYLAIVAGFLGTIIAAVLRDFVVRRGGALGPDSSRIPTLVLIYAVVASLAGSSAATEVAQQSELTAPVWIGTLAGLFSTILMSMLMITYFTHPGETPKLRR